MKFKVGDRVQKIIRGDVVIGTVTYASDTVQMYDVAWDQTGMPFTTMEMEIKLEVAVEVISVPRTLLEDIGAMLCHNKFCEHDALREAISLLLESK